MRKPVTFVNMPLSKYRIERQKADVKDPRLASCHLYPEDIGLSRDYECTIWLAFTPLYQTSIVHFCVFVFLLLFS